MTVTVNSVRDAIVEAVGNLEGVAHCAKHRGDINLAEVMRTSFKSPAVFIAYGGAPKLQKTPEGFFAGDHIWAAFVVVTGKKDIDGEAIDLAWAVADLIDLNCWGFDAKNEIEPGRVDGVDNLYSMAGDDKGVALYGVRFTHRMIIGTNTFEDDLAATSGNFDILEAIPSDVTLGQVMRQTTLDGTGDAVDAGDVSLKDDLS